VLLWLLMLARRIAPLLLIALAPFIARAQDSASSPPPSQQPAAPSESAPASAPAERTPKQRFEHYLFDVFGPYAVVRAAASGGIDQANNAPPEWGQGAAGYGSRLGSNFGIGAIDTTTRYALSELLRQDVTYYRCECTGFFPRLGHALLSNVTARTRSGRRVFSAPQVVAPYAAALSATAAWYPGRFNTMDGFRQGNYALGSSFGLPVAKEFIWFFHRHKP
jgi:hypothetical protein